MNQNDKTQKYSLFLLSFRHRSTSRLVERIAVAIIFCLFFLFYSCEKNKTPTEIIVPQPEIRLSLTEAPRLREICLKVEVLNVKLPRNFQISRNDSIVLNGQMTTADSVLKDTGLSSATEYRYQAYLLQNGTVTDTSNLLQAHTMDTTSHDFQWEIIEIPSPYGSGVLRDVAIINENDIWAVGEIYADSAQPWLPYNAVHWDGQQWELKRIPTNSVVGIGYYPINAVFAFNPNNIWMFSDAGSYCHWNGNQWKSKYVSERQGGINKIWGSSPNDIYFVGTNGNITHYNGSNWQKIESGTDLPMMDIYGTLKNENGQYEILCVAEDYGAPGGSKVFSIENNNVHELSTNGLLSYGLWGIWFMPGRKYSAVGDGLWETHSLDGTWVRNGSLPALFKTSINGTDINDIVVGGAFWLLAHYNGMNWQTYFPTTSGSFGEVAIKGDLVIAVGDINNSAVIVRGKRL